MINVVQEFESAADLIERGLATPDELVRSLRNVARIIKNDEQPVTLGRHNESA